MKKRRYEEDKSEEIPPGCNMALQTLSLYNLKPLRGSQMQF
jgi:hypothetical protein